MSALMGDRRDGVVFLTYHLVEGQTSTVVDIPLEVFQRQMEQIQPIVTSLDGALDHLRLGSPGTKVVVTFDDAFANFHTRAWPVLSALRIPSVLYVPTDFVDGRGPSPLRGAERLPACSWAQIRELVSDGLVTIGAHGRTHRDLSRLSVEEVQAEVTGSRARLEEMLQRDVRTFCYPGGRTSRAARSSVRDLYESAVIRGGRKATSRSWSPWSLQRVPIRRDMPATLDNVLRSGIWLEEWVATRLGLVRDRLVRLRPRPSARGST